MRSIETHFLSYKPYLHPTEDPFRNPQCCTIARIHFFASSCSIHRNSGRSTGSPVRLLRDLLQRKISSVPAFGLFKGIRLRF